MIERKGTITGALLGGLASLVVGAVLSYQASLEGQGFKATADVPYPWLHAIAVNSLIAAVFFVPLAAIFGRWIGAYLDHCGKSGATSGTQNSRTGPS